MVEQKYIDYWKARQAEEDARIKVLEAEAWEDIAKVAAVLREQFKATQIIVFGSLVRDRFGEDSDIDIAAAGIEHGDFFRALAVVNDYSRREIDLKPIESLEPHFKERVLSTGRVLDEDS